MVRTAQRPHGETDSASKLWIYLAFFAMVSCAPGIGDECQTSADCSQGGERLCDVTQRGGYCTVFNCEPGSCPDDSICVAFAAAESAAAECADASGLSRFSRSFCLAPCDSKADCRSGYACIDLGKPNPWNAIVIDSGSGKVCIQPLQGQELPPERSSEVCSAATND
jgi:hypothetical protein